MAGRIWEGSRGEGQEFFLSLFINLIKLPSIWYLKLEIAGGEAEIAALFDFRPLMFLHFVQDERNQYENWRTHAHKSIMDLC